MRLDPIEYNRKWINYSHAGDTSATSGHNDNRSR